MRIPVNVKSEFDRSEVLDAHIARRLDATLGAFAPHIRAVEVRLSDVNGPRHGRDDKVANVEVALERSGHVVASAAHADLYASVSRALLRARSRVARRIVRARWQDARDQNVRPPAEAPGRQSPAMR